MQIYLKKIKELKARETLIPSKSALESMGLHPHVVVQQPGDFIVLPMFAAYCYFTPVSIYFNYAKNDSERCNYCWRSLVRV
jgi:hypothetical protein